MRDELKSREQLIDEKNELQEELKKTKNACRENKSQTFPLEFSLIIDNMQDVVYLVDKDLNIKYVTPSIEEKFGEPPGNKINTHFDFDRVHPDDLPGLMENIKKVKETKVIGRAEFRRLNKDGHYVWFEGIGTPLLDEESNLTGAIVAIRDIQERKRMEENLQKSEKKFRKLFDNANDAIILFKLTEENLPGPIIEANDVACHKLGYTREELLSMTPVDVEDKDSIKNLPAKTEKIMRDGNITFESVHVSKEGDKIPVEVKSHLFYLDGQKVILSAARDITERKRNEDKLHKLYAAIETSMDGIAILDGEERYTYMNKAHAEIYGYDSPDELIGKTWKVLYDGDELNRIEEKVKPVLASKGKWRGRAVGKKRDGSTFHQEVSLGIIDRSGMVCIVRDITKQKRIEKWLRYLSLYDKLTGLYNRNFFEQEMKRMEKKGQAPAGIIMCDVNGLKLINDTLGHDAGDRLLITAANLIKEAIRKEDVVARIGGDEFAVLLPGAGNKDVKTVTGRIRDAVKEHNEDNQEVPLSISVGFSAGSGESCSMGDLFKEADNYMYREKLLNNRSVRNVIVQTLMKALEARDFVTEGHACRLNELIERLVEESGLGEHKLADIKLLAQFHDIGKVGIPDRILFKEGPLTLDEKDEMKRHCEIGFRIAQSSPELFPVADWILKHHEWWNGEGYPLGLKGEEIPLECRILAIVDAYDAMISDRPYRKAMSNESAIGELKRCSGTQFDPDLVEKFVKILEHN